MRGLTWRERGNRNRWRKKEMKYKSEGGEVNEESRDGTTVVSTK